MTVKSDSRRVFIPLAILLSLLLLAVVLMPAGTARAENENHCGRGEVQAAFQAAPVGLFTVTPSKAGLGGGVANCYYPIFDEGAEYTFSSSDLILGSVTNFIPLDYFDVTPQEAIELLQTSEDRLFLGPVGTPVDQLVEQELMETTYKHMVHPDFGHIVYQTRGVILQLEPGTYTSRNEWVWPLFTGGNEVQVATVTIHIVEE